MVGFLMMQTKHSSQLNTLNLQELCVADLPPKSLSKCVGVFNHHSKHVLVVFLLMVVVNHVCMLC